MSQRSGRVHGLARRPCPVWVGVGLLSLSVEFFNVDGWLTHGLNEVHDVDDV